MIVAMALLLAVQGGGGLPAGAMPDWADAAHPAMLETVLRPEPGEDTGGPACIADVCQGVVWLPGSDPFKDQAGRKSGLTLAIVSRLDVGTISAMARTVAISGVRLDYRPPTADGKDGVRTGGYGKVNFGVRWRLDALFAPVWTDPFAR